jgi:glycine cleavage system H lipoate-binding protein
VLVDLLIQRIPARARVTNSDAVHANALRRNGGLTGFRIPRGYYFHPGHTWASYDRADSEGSWQHPVRIGADDFSVTILGKIDNIHFPRKGTTVIAGAPLFSLIQGDKKIDFPAPVSGTVVDVNEELMTQPEHITKDSYKSGWIASLYPENLVELASLARNETAAERLRRDVRKFRDFLMELAGRESELGITLADGGVPRCGVLEEFSQQEWERFQKEFLGLQCAGRHEQ